MKNLFLCVLFLMSSVMIVFGWQIGRKDHKKLSELGLKNIEALASSESDSGQSNWCKTGNITSYGIWVLHCGNCDMQMVSYATGEGYCYKK